MLSIDFKDEKIESGLLNITAQTNEMRVNTQLNGDVKDGESKKWRKRLTWKDVPLLQLFRCGSLTQPPEGRQYFRRSIFFFGFIR